MKKYICTSIKSIATITALLALCLQGYAQDKKQELSIAVAGPGSFLKYSSGATVVPGNGFSAGIRYSYYLSETLSLGIGAEYQTYNSDAKYAFTSGQYMTTDAEKENFQFRYKATNLREEQKLSYVNIPITIQFETPGTTKLYVAGGAKIGFATNGTYETKIQNLTTSGYYSQYNVELFNPTFAGFGSFNDVKASKQDLKTDVSYAITFETGVKHNIGTRSSIYFGAFIDYGLNNIYDKSESKNTVQYNPDLPVQFQYNSVLDSPFAHNIRLVSYGLKLRFAIR